MPRPNVSSAVRAARPEAYGPGRDFHIAAKIMNHGLCGRGRTERPRRACGKLPQRMAKLGRQPARACARPGKMKPGL